MATLAQIERAHIINTVTKLNGHLVKATKELGISRPTLWRKLKAYGFKVEIADREFYMSAEAKAKIRQAMKLSWERRKPLSPAVRANISRAAKLAWERRRKNGTAGWGLGRT
jgi:hypothetical protein